MMQPEGILIFAEMNEDGKILPVVFQLLTKARELKHKIWNQDVIACVTGPRMKYDDIITELGEYGADKVIIVNDDILKEYSTEVYSEIFFEIAEKYFPRIMLFGATPTGKEIASYASTKFETGLTADCSDLDINEENILLSTRPTFGGQLIAEILYKTCPQCATVRENTFTAEKKEPKVTAIFDRIDPFKIEQKIQTVSKQKKEKNFKDLSEAKIIIAGGKGACKDNGFNLIYTAAQRLNAAVGGSREAYEAGYITKAQQIGQTGISIAPDLYIAAGISGANQHIIAIKNAKKVIAINNNPNAPIFKYADIGIKGDLFKVLPDLIEKLDKNNKKYTNNSTKEDNKEEKDE